MAYALALMAAATLAACAGPSPAPAPPDPPPSVLVPPDAPTSASDPVTFDGTVTYTPVEGGAWVLRSDAGQTYQPLALADEFKVEGLRVRVEAEVQTETMSTLQVGPIVRVVRIERLPSSETGQAGAPARDLLVVAHRGASGRRPEHTLAAYRLAVEEGADVIEPDVVATRDGVLVVRHENEVSGTTDIAGRPEFAGRRTTKTVDGRPVTGWFTEDLTLAEVKTLRAVERLPELRPESAAYDGQFPVPTLAEVVALAAELGAARGRPVGVYPETKHPSHFRRIGLPLEVALVDLLHGAGLTERDDPAWVQSFEVGNLELLRGLTRLRLVQLVAPDGGPADRPELTYRAMTTASGLATVATYADAVGPATSMVVDDALAPTALVADTHRAGLAVHAWTVRPENAFLPPPLRSGDAASGHGDVTGWVRALAAAGVDGLFTDVPAETLAALGR